MSETVLTRRELYNLVWSTPTIRLAERFGISDRGLAKLCERHRIPTPPRGHWAKVEAGKKVRQANFVEVSDDPRLNRVAIRGADRLPDEVQAIIAKNRATEVPADSDCCPPKIEPASRKALHPAIRETASALRKRTGDRVVRALGPGACGVVVGIDTAERAIRLLDALTRAIHAAGMVIKPAGRCIEVCRGNQKDDFRLIEQTRQVPHVLTAEERASDLRMARGRPGVWDKMSALLRPKYDYVRRGELRIELAGGYGPPGSRARWADGKRQLEQLIPEIVSGFILYFDLVELRQRQLAIENLKREEFAKRQALALKRREREEARMAIVLQFIQADQETERMSIWLARIETNAADHPGGEYARMVSWCKARLASMLAKTDPTAVEELLRSKDLFPDADQDGLQDPLGEPSGMSLGFVLRGFGRGHS